MAGGSRPVGLASAIATHPYMVSVACGGLFGSTAVLASLGASWGLRLTTEAVALTAADISAFGGAVVGAVVGGAIAYFLQSSALKHQKTEREALAASQRQAMAHALIFKVLTIVNDLAHLKLHVDECEARVADVNGKLPKFAVAYLLPLLNIPPPVHLEAAEMGMLFSIGESEVFNQVMEIAPIHNSILPVWAHYSAMKAELNVASSDFNLETGVGEMTFTAGSVVAIKFFEANQVAEQIAERARRDYDDADKCFQALLDLFKSELGVGVATISSPQLANETATPR